MKLKELILITLIKDVISIVGVAVVRGAVVRGAITVTSSRRRSGIGLLIATLISIDTSNVLPYLV